MCLRERGYNTSMRKRGYVFVTFLLILTIAIITYFLFNFTPLKKGNGISETLLMPFSQLTLTLVTSGRGSSDIDTLRKENNVLREQIVKARVEKKEISALQDQFQTTQIPSQQLMPAHIISMRTFLPGITSPDIVLINKGSTEGVKKGQVVVIGETVIGQVSKVSEHIAEVKLLSAQGSSVTVETGKTGALGILRGHGNGSMRLENVLLSDQLEKNDIVMTKGDVNIDGLGIPPGLAVGKIQAVSKKASDLFQSAEVTNTIVIPETLVVFILTLK